MTIVFRLHVKDCLGMVQTAANCKVSTGTTATQLQVVRSCGKVGFVWPAALFQEKRKPSLSLTVWERNLLSFKILTLFFFFRTTQDKQNTSLHQMHVLAHSPRGHALRHFPLVGCVSIPMPGTSLRWKRWVVFGWRRRSEEKWTWSLKQSCV